MIQWKRLPSIAVTLRIVRGLFWRSPQNFLWLFLVGFSLSLLFAACTPNNNPPATNTTASNPSPAKTAIVRIGYQKSSGLLNYLRSQGTLEKRFAPEGVTVTWNEFAATPQLLEAMSVGSIDFTFGSGVAGVVSQAAGRPLVRVAYEPVGTKSSGVLVPKDSPIKSVADLKGKKVALAKATGIHFVLVLALEKAGLKFSDIEPVYLAPGDARAAFESGKIDAWGMWNPVFTEVQRKSGARVILDSEGLTPGYALYYASQNFAQEQPERLRIILEELNQVNGWAKNNRRAMAEFLSPVLGIDVDTLEAVEQQREYSGVKPIDDAVLDEQQRIADKFLELGLTPKKIDARASEAIWKSAQTW